MIHWIRSHRILFALGILSCITSASVQSQTSLQQLSMKDGLTSEKIESIFQDNKGFMYFGTTFRGLNRFDGLRVKSWIPRPDSPELNYPAYGWTMAEERNGIIWIGGGFGLYQYDPKKDQFKVFRPVEPPGILTCITGVYLDKSDNLWIGGGELGLLRFDLTTQEFETSEEVFGKKTKCPFKTIILEDSHGDLWFSAPNGLYQVPPKKPVIYHPLRPDIEREENDYYVHALCEDDRGNVWVGTQNELIKYDHQKKLFMPISLPLIKSGVRAAIKGPQGHLWLVPIDREEDGVYVLDPETHHMYNHFVQIGLPDVFVNTKVWSLSFDRSGGLWIGTLDRGVLYWNVHQKPFKTYQTDYNDKRLILFDKKERQIWSSLDGRLTPFQFNNQQHVPLIQSENFMIAQDKNKSIWKGSWEGLSRFRYVEGRWIQSPKEAINWPGLKGTAETAATHVYADTEGDLWVSVHLDQLYRYDDGSNTFKPFPLVFPGTSDTLKKFSAKVFEDHHGFTWVSARGQLFKIEGDSIVKTVPNIPFVNDSYIDVEGIFWLATIAGLHRLDPNTGDSKYWLRNDGLPHDILYSILADDHRNFWIGTQNGLSVFNPELQTFRNFDSSDGIPSDEFYEGALKSSTGALFFVTTRGLVHFHPDSISDNPYVPSVVITELQINNKKAPIQGSLGDSLKMPSPLIQDISYTDEIHLKWNQNDVSFEFASLNYLQSEKNQYEYRLLPRNEEWIRTGAERPFATYTNLNSGSYTFEVRGSNNDGKWNKEAVQLNMLISPPWFKTWWAYSIYGFSILTILWLIRRFEIARQQLKYQLEIENVRAEKLQEMNEVKSRFFTNISHEFRTPLTLMLGPVSDLMKNASGAQLPYLELIQRNSHRVLNLINQLLDLSKIENKEMRLEASLQDVVPFIRQVFSAFSSIGKVKEIRSIYHTRAESIFLYFDSYKLEKVLLNILSNAYKFTPEGGDIKIDVEVRNQGISYDHMARDGRQVPDVEGFQFTSMNVADWPVVHTMQAWDDSIPILVLTITDSGPGVAKDALPHVFDRFYQTRNPYIHSHEGTGIGLALAKELIHLHHGRITVRSKVGKGTSFSIQLPLGKSHLSPQEIVVRSRGSELDITMIGSLIQTQPISSIIDGDSTLPLILLVEDNSDMRSYIRLHLQDDYKLIEVENGQQGLDIALQEVPDIVLSDVMMPVMDGLELCKRLKSDHRTSHIPVVLLTARAEIESRIEGLQCGADAYLAKPFDQNELLVRIEKLLTLRETLQARYIRMDPITSRNPATQKEDDFIHDLQLLIQENLHDPDFGIHQICRALQMSRAQVYRKVKALTGVTVNHYLRKFRLRKAIQLLKDQTLNVSEVAYDVGFKDPAYFSRTFRSEFGVSPSEYASKYIEGNNRQ